MNKYIWKYGVPAGLLLGGYMFYAMNNSACSTDGGNQTMAMIQGFAAGFIAYSSICFAVLEARKKSPDGSMTFKNAFMMGLAITAIVSTIYVIAWAIDYHFFIPDFMDKYTAHEIREAQKKGATAAEIAKKVKEAADIKESYKNPIIFAAYTYAEILPSGILMSLIFGLILKRKPTGIEKA
ncbi:MAG: DUF4199 domain-containing protein [Chitinophagia bacterium]|nr:DUF4199 domain-containing protein [Chitinophagia bacterium]